VPAEPIVARVYVRISRATDGSTLGVERQEPPCRAFCDDQGWPVAEVYVDNNTSAYREGVKRDDFERLLADVRADHRAGRRNAIVTWQADRLLRTVEDASAIVAIAKRYETLVANVGGTIDFSTADGRKRFYELAVAAQYESELKSERLKLKHAELRRYGKWAGGRRPFGYRVVGTKLHSRKRADCTRTDDDGCPLVECELELEPAEADEIGDAARRILRGRSITGLQREWVRRGIRRPNGGIFAGQHLRDMLVNPRLTGRRRGQDLAAEPQWPPILTVAEHEHLVAKLGPGRNPVGQRAAPGPRVYELRGFLYCAVERDGQRCGNRLRGKPSDAKRRYVCDSRDGGCEGVKVVADAVEGHVRDAVIAAFDDPQMGPKIRQRLAAKLANPAREQELVAAKETAKDALARLGDDYADGLLTGVQVERATRRLQQRIDAAEEELAGIRQSAGIMVELPEGAEAMRRAWDSWDIEERRQVIGLAVKRVWVKRAGQGKRFTADRVEFDWLV
jgi:DNA invertase Pin-like site-specific DNA recombinase